MNSSSEVHLQQDNNENEEGDDSGENMEFAEADSTQVYQIRPRLEEKFKPLSAREIIHNVLFDLLSTKVYDKEEAPVWSKEIADTIRDKIKKLDFKKYKYIINVVLGHRDGSGVKMGTRCIWDAEADTYAHDSFTRLNILRCYCLCCLPLLNYLNAKDVHEKESME